MKHRFIGIFIATFACNTQAAFIDNVTYTIDTDTGLDWLDVTASVDMSYNDANSQLGSGGLFEGWRYATGLDFNPLVANATMAAAFDVTVMTRQIHAHFDEVDALPRPLDPTVISGGSQGILGITDDSFSIVDMVALKIRTGAYGRHITGAHGCSCHY